MISDLDIWRTAWAMMKRYGDSAELEAARRADELLAQGDLAGQAVWLRVCRAVAGLLATAPDGVVH